MNDVIHAAIAKTKALKALCEQWTLEISEIKSPETEYREKRQLLLSNYDKEICQLGKHTADTNEYAKRSDAFSRPAERQFAERLETANKRLACDLFQTLGDTLWDHSVSTVLHQCLSSKTPMVEATGVKEGSKALLKARSEKESDLNITAQTPIDLEEGQNQSLLPVTVSSEHQDRALAQASALTEARVLIQRETMNHRKAALHQTPIQERETALQSNQVNDEQGATSPVWIQAPAPSPTTETSRLSENVVDPQARSSSRAMLASETNLDQNGGRARLDMWPSSQIQNQSASSAEGAGTPNNNPGEKWTDSLVAHLCAPLKRLQAEASNQKHKRQKLPVEPPNIPEERVISFDEVFQDGKAQTKYIIVQHPPELGHWYILECKEHNKHFYQDPIQGATRHLIGQEHGISGDHSLAVKMLGTRVLDCNEKLAAKNNWITRRSFPQVAGPMSVTPGNRTKEDLTQEVGIIPVVGEIYAARYPTKSHAYAVLVLPWTAFDHFPHMKQLLRDTPACFLFDKTVDQCPRGWAKGYEDGGHRFKERAYPVVYFHKDKFPEQCNVGWAPITSFKAYIPGHTEVVFSKIVDQYLRNKDPRLTANHGYSTANSIVIPDDNDHEDAHIEHGNGEMSGNASRNESHLLLKDKRLKENTKLQAESSTADPKTSYNSPSQGDGTVVPRSQTHTQERSAAPGQMARIEYPFVSGGSEDVEKTGSTTSHVATATPKQPIVNVVELGEVHADSAFNRPPPRNEDTYSRVSLRPS